MFRLNEFSGKKEIGCSMTSDGLVYASINKYLIDKPKAYMNKLTCNSLLILVYYQRNKCLVMLKIELRDEYDNPIESKNKLI